MTYLFLVVIKRCLNLIIDESLFKTLVALLREIDLSTNFFVCNVTTSTELQ